LAVKRYGNAVDDITIVAVSKQQSVAAVRDAQAAGLVHFGENYLQEAAPKIAELAGSGLCWHYIGTIQTNKTRQIAGQFDWVETIDRARVAERLSEQRPAARGPLNVLIQFNPDAEPQKGGVAASELLPLARAIGGLRGLSLRGLMCIPAAGQDNDSLRATFKSVTAAAARLRDAGFAIDTISMGMSADFELAVECGATSIRVGTALFGERGRSR
jgi:pyridoxal phosphate enzyme (YggS family)